MKDPGVGTTVEEVAVSGGSPSVRWRESVLLPRITRSRLESAHLNELRARRLEAERVEKAAKRPPAPAPNQTTKRHVGVHVEKPKRGAGLPKPKSKPAPVRPRNGHEPFAWLRRSAGIAAPGRREPNPMQGLIAFHWKRRLEKWERCRRNKAGAQMRARQRRMA